MQTHMPMGYEIVKGRIVVEEEKSKTVQTIFSEYVKGKTICAIAKELTEKKVPKGTGRTDWAHAAVGRILEDTNYVGNEVYPQLIEQELFQQVAEKRKTRAKKLGREIQPNSFQNKNVFSNKVFCGTCGKAYKIYVEHGGTSYEKRKWKCKGYVYENKVLCKNLFYTKEELMEISVGAINDIIHRPSLLEQKPIPYRQRKRDALLKVEEEITRLEETEEVETRELVKLIFQRAMLTYQESKIDDYEVHTQFIKDVLEDRKPMRELEEEIFREIVEQIRIYEDGRVQLQFINGVIITKQYKKEREPKDGNGKKNSGIHTTTNHL